MVGTADGDIRHVVARAPCERVPAIGTHNKIYTRSDFWKAGANFGKHETMDPKVKTPMDSKVKTPMDPKVRTPMDPKVKTPMD